MEGEKEGVIPTDDVRRAMMYAPPVPPWQSSYRVVESAGAYSLEDSTV